MTFAELDAASDALAGELRAAGVGADGPVGLLMKRGPAVMVASYALWKVRRRWCRCRASGDVMSAVCITPGGPCR